MTHQNPQRGEIWLVSFDPQVGEEIQKTRPALVLSINSMAKLKTRYVVPIRDMKDFHSAVYYYYPLQPNRENKLQKPSSADCTQAKSVSLQRFVKATGGKISASDLKEIADTVGYLLGL
jgi:mRNA interferase MazF